MGPSARAPIARRDPIFLHGSVTLAPNSEGGVNAQALMNPLGVPMELTEIRFGLRSTARVYGGVIEAKLSFGRRDLTNGFVPVWCFGPQRNGPMLTASYTTSTVGGGEELADSTDGTFFREFAWKIPRPLYIPGGMTVIPSLRHTGVVAANAVCRVGYCCRALHGPGAGPAPSTIFVPYAAAYVSKSFTSPGAAADSDASRETDLANIHPEPLRLQRFCGRLAMFYTSSAFVEECFVPEVGHDQMTVRIEDSLGNAIVRENAAATFRAVFGGATRSWELNAMLPGGGFYNVALDLASGALTTADYAQAFISIVGHHEIPLGAIA